MKQENHDTEEEETEEEQIRARRRDRRPARRRYVNRGGRIAEISAPPQRETR